MSTFAVAIAALLVYRSYAHDLKPPEEAIAEATIGTSIAYDRTGQSLLYEYVDPLGGLREPVPLSEMSPYLIAATSPPRTPASMTTPASTSGGWLARPWRT